jgi:hypothetical protein
MRVTDYFCRVLCTSFFETQLNFAMLDKAKLSLCFTLQSPVVILMRRQG